MNYRKINNLFGWLIGAIAYIVYLKTMEPTASFWDCGEFLSCAYRLEVGHSPGAPFFMLLQRMFGLFAPSADKVALFINSLSALMSGLTILFLFWTITHMAKKMVSKDNAEPDGNQTALIMGAGIIGALAYTFSDTFWFSAVEAEVYATSSFFTAITFWAIFKWEDVADNKYADRWLVLIFYLIGLSVAVHLLNLLTIPAIVMVYYFKRYETTTVGSIIAFLIGCVILGIVQFGVIQYIPSLASKFELIFVNNFGLPLDSGAIFFVVLLMAFLVWLLYFARKKALYLVHLATLCLIFIIIGYSSYIVAIIRSRADVPIDMTNPDNVISFLSYVNREQFGQQPLLFGPDFTSQPNNIADKGPIYVLSKKNGKDFYEVDGKKLEPEYDAANTRFFPRIWDNNEAMHINFYRNFLNLGKDETPTASDNMKYFMQYQMNWMWWRYFMWNYAGRQNDIEGQGEARNGNWISGIKMLDKRRVGDLDLMSKGYRDNGARNELYFLPLILGLMGMFFHFSKDRKKAIIVMVLFFFTGAAIGIFLNMPPVQPRERDYAFAGCTYAFAIWIGLGVLMLNEWMQKFVKGKATPIISTAICLLLVPTLMAKTEWDDHDRSKKTLARAVAYNTLMSCEPNAILFTAGDNQTYPLWYLQEIEGVRHDVRIINTSLLGIDWYIDQMNYRINDADALPMAWKRAGYIGDHCNYIRYVKTGQVPENKFFNLEEICNFITSDDPSNKLPMSNGESDNYFPTKNFYIPAHSKEFMVEHHLVKAEDTARINTEFKFTYPKNVAYKSDIAILNILAGVAKDGWRRPMYFDAGLPADNYVGLADYLKLEGILYRVMPYKTIDSVKDSQVLGTIDIDKSFKLFTDTYIWGGSERNDVYFDEPNRREFFPYRMDAAFLANSLASRNRKADAVKVLNRVMQGITEHAYPYDFTAYYVASAYFRAGASDSGMSITNKLYQNMEDDLKYTNSLDDDGKSSMSSELNQYWQMLASLNSIAQSVSDTASSKKIEQKMRTIAPSIKPYISNGRGGGNEGG